MLPDSELDPALEARQRRMERRRTASAKDSVPDEQVDDDTNTATDGAYESDESEDENPPPSSKKRKTSMPLSQIRGIKKQARYEPEVPMSKDELVAWRKEARRVRNRESAAASRNKTRQRIEELEEQVDALQLKYDGALRRIAELEAENQQPAQEEASLCLPEPTKVLSQIDAVPNQVSPPLSPRETNEVVSRPTWSLSHQQAAQALADSLSFSLDEFHGPPFSPTTTTTRTMQYQKQKEQHPVTISRPTAV